jgi:hypothetical protein
LTTLWVLLFKPTMMMKILLLLQHIWLADNSSFQKCMEKFFKTFVKPKSNKNGHMLLGNEVLIFGV